MATCGLLRIFHQCLRISRLVVGKRFMSNGANIKLFEGMKAYRTEDSRAVMFRTMENIKKMERSAKRSCLPSCSNPGVELCVFQNGKEKNTIKDSHNIFFKDLSEFFYSTLENLPLDLNLLLLKHYYEELLKLSSRNHHHQIFKLQGCNIFIPNALGQYNLSLTIKKEIALTFDVKPILYKILHKEKSLNKYSTKADKSEKEYLLEDFIEQIDQNQLLKKLMQHPVFWTENEKIDFILNASKYFNINKTKLNDLETFNQLSTDKISPDMYGDVYFYGKWNKIREIKHSNQLLEKINTVEDYLWFFRNRWWQHFDNDSYENEKKWLGFDTSNEMLDPVTFWKNITKPLPQFLLFMYKNFHEDIKKLIEPITPFL